MSQSFVLQSAISIAREAANIILSIYQEGIFEQETKQDNTPVTSADLAAHQYITQQLQAHFPDIPVLSEEDATIPLSDRKSWSRYWLIDPLDGTQEFIAKSDEFATIIALVENNVPVMGVVCSPVSGVVYCAEKGKGAWIIPPNASPITMGVRSVDESRNTLKIAVSRRQDPQIIRQYFTDKKHYELIFLGSASLKACLVAEGKVDCYLRIGPTGEWDTGATQCIVEEAGGKIVDLSLAPLSYNQRESFENPNFVVIGDTGLTWKEILTL